MSKKKNRHPASKSSADNSRPPKAPASPSTKNLGNTRKLFFICAALAVFTLAIFYPAAKYDFIICDDGLYVSENPIVLRGLTAEGLHWAFTTFHAANWHPLTWISHMLEVTLFGKNPGAFHFSNVLLHSANVVLLFAWLFRMSGALWRSAIVAGLFASHPLHVESVAWIAERKDVLSTFFGFLALFMYARYARNKAAVPRADADSRRSTLNYLGTLLFFTLSLLSKPMLVTFPFVLLLLDYWPLQRFVPGKFRSSVTALTREKLPFFILSFADAIITVIAQSYGGAVQSLDRFPVSLRLQNALISYGRYLLKAIVPVNLTQPYSPPEQWHPAIVILCCVLLASVSIIAIRLRRRHPFLITGWLFFLGTLVPVIGLVQVGVQSMADRYTYVPLIGIFIAVVWGANAVRTEGPMTALAQAVAVVVLGVCALLSRLQLGHWENSGTLLSHSISVTRNNAMAYYDLGLYLQGKGEFDAALTNYRCAIQIVPRYAKALNNAGRILTEQHRFEEAIGYYQSALRADPNHTNTLNNLGVTLAATRRFAEAADAYERALRLNPDFPQPHYNLGVALEAIGQPENALQHYSEAVRLKPDYWEAHTALGNLLLSRRRAEEAVPHFEESLRLNPAQPMVHFSLGNALAIQGKFEQAVAHFRTCVESLPDYAPAHKNLGTALCMLGRREEGISHLKAALRLKPDYEDARRELQAVEARN